MHHEHPPSTTTTSPRNGLADLGRVGFDDAGRTVEVQVALTHATLAIAARLVIEEAHSSRHKLTIANAPPLRSSGRGAS